MLLLRPVTVKVVTVILPLLPPSALLTALLAGPVGLQLTSEVVVPAGTVQENEMVESVADIVSTSMVGFTGVGTERKE